MLVMLLNTQLEGVREEDHIITAAGVGRMVLFHTLYFNSYFNNKKASSIFNHV